MKKYGKYINRDISWLSFNGRVLEEAANHSLPLYERLKFLAIYSSNLDEFYKVRVAACRRYLDGSSDDGDLTGKKAAAVLKEILRIVEKQQDDFGTIFWKELVPALSDEKIMLVHGVALEGSQKDFAEDYFFRELLPYLHPLMLVRGKVLPFLRDDDLYLAIKLFRKSEPGKMEKNQRKPRYALVNIPSDRFPRFMELPAADGNYCIMFLDDLIRLNLEALFPGYDIDSSYSVKLSRDADLGIEDEFTGDLAEKIRTSLVNRNTGVPARFLYDADIPDHLLGFLRKCLKLSRIDLVPGGRYHNFSDLFSLPNPHSPRLEIKPFPPLYRKEMGAYRSILEAVGDRDWMLHFPYHSYEPVIRFLNEAAIDPGVREIKITQYRVAEDSAVVNALINARSNGKKVTVFVELKARFDEFANIQFARTMKNAGIRIIYSIPGLKVHAKAALVLMKKTAQGNRKAYAFLSTGNFNEKTARIYSDHGLFTSNNFITNELKGFFKFLENQEERPKFKHLLVARFNMKKKYTQLIEREIRNAEAGLEARMILKMNGLDHRKMIQRLYEASRKGVKIDLLVRGICCLVPGKNYSENITVTRIVDRFLEHARVFAFHNGGEPEVYLASADWMNRNLERRIELGFPILDAEIRKEILEILNFQLSDNTSARVLDSEHNNFLKPAAGKRSIRAQAETYRFLKRNG